MKFHEKLRMEFGLWDINQYFQVRSNVEDVFHLDLQVKWFIHELNGYLDKLL